MKKLALLSALVIGGLFCKTADAQIGISLGFNIRPHHVYVPAPNIAVETPVYVEDYPASYDGDDDYYYLPDVDAYYNVARECYYYNNGGNWVSATYLPGYPNYSWRNVRRYEVRANRPYLNDGLYRSRYHGYARNFNHNDNRVYDNRNFNRDNYRSQGQHFDNRGDRNQGREWGQQFDRGRNYAQPSHGNHDQGNYGQSNRDQGNHDQQFNNRQERGNNNGQQHIAENRGQDGRMRF